MKKLGSMLCLAFLTMLISANVAFGAGLEFERSFPEEGMNNLNPQNVAIKLVFSEKISDPVSIAANAGKFSIVDAEGKAVKFEPLYNESKYANEVWLQISETLTQNTGYKVIVFEGVQSSSGNTLDRQIEVNFATRNTEADSKGYMVLMVIMVVGMMVFTVFDTKRKLKKESGAKQEDQKVNPYKEAKRTGKTVEQVVAKTEKEKAQAEKKQARVAKRQLANEGEEKKPKRPGVKAVKQAKPISEKGYKTPQSYIDGRIAREVAKNKQRADSKSQQQRSKGSKQQQRKKK